MTAYDVFTIYILVGVFSYVDHLVYVGGCCSDEYYKEIRRFEFFLFSIAYFPAILYVTMKIRLDVYRQFKQWLKENGHDVK